MYADITPFVVPARPRSARRGQLPAMSPLIRSPANGRGSPQPQPQPPASPIDTLRQSSSGVGPAASPIVVRPRRLDVLTPGGRRGAAAAAPGATEGPGEELTRALQESTLRDAQNAIAGGTMVLDLSSQGLSAHDAAAIAGMLRRGPRLVRVLRLDRNNIRLTQEIAASLTSVRLQTIVFSHNALGDSGVELLASCLMDNRCLTSLALGGNAVTAAGAAAMAPWLSRESTLRLLHLQENPLGDAGIHAVAIALERNASLTTLDLHGTAMTARGAASLATSLGPHPTLSVLYVGANDLGDDGAFSLACLLQMSAAIACIYADHCRIGDAGGYALLRAAGRGGRRTLGLLSLQGNLLTSVGLRGALFGELRMCTSLQVFRASSEDTPEVNAEMRTRYRQRHVRWIIQTRALSLSRRGRFSDPTEPAAWLCARAPHWVIVHVVRLLIACC